jgi:hypothetical protein
MGGVMSEWKLFKCRPSAGRFMLFHVVLFHLFLTWRYCRRYPPLIWKRMLASMLLEYLFLFIVTDILVAGMCSGVDVGFGRCL